MSTIRVGVIGTGFIARTHVDAFRRACLLFPDIKSDVIIELVADASLGGAQAFATAAQIGRAVDDWRLVVDDPRIDLVDIATPNNLHYPIAMAAIAAGKAVYCEKPLALSYSEARQMADAAAAKGVRTFVAFNNLFAPSTQLAKALIARGDIGEPLEFSGSFDQGFYSDRELPASWRTQRNVAGSGALGDLGSHIISIAQNLMGQISSVAALDAIVFKDRPLPGSGAGYGATAADNAVRLAVENDDLFRALVRFENGALGTVGASRTAAGRVFGINWEIRGTAGSLHVDNERMNELHVFRMSDAKDDRGFKSILCGSQVEGFKQGFFGFDYGGGGIGYFDVKVLEICGMLMALRTSDRWPCDFAFGAENQAVVDAIAQSAIEGGAMRKVGDARMKLALYTDSLAKLSLPACLDFCAERKLTHVELGTGNWSSAPHIDPASLLTSRDRRDELLGQLSARGLALSALNCSGNPLHPVEGEEHRHVISQTIQLAALLGLDRIVTMSGCPAAPGDRHPNWITTSWPPETSRILAWQWSEQVLPYWRETAALARQHGVRLCFEMHGMQCVYNVESFQRLRDVIGEIAGVNFDPSHLLWMGADPIAAVGALEGSIYHVHAKDTRLEPAARLNSRLDAKAVMPVEGRSWNFVAVGRGQDRAFWSGLIAALQAGGYDDVLSIENEDYALPPEQAVDQAISFVGSLIRAA